MSQDIIRSVPLKSEQKLPNSKFSGTKESKVRSYREETDITCYLLIADIFIGCGDFKNADRYFKEAADLGNLYAQNELSYEDATELHDYKKEHLLTPELFANDCTKSTKTPSPRLYWMLGRLYERLPGVPDLSKAKEYYKKASASGYLRAYIDLNQSNELFGPKTHEEIREHYNEVIKIDNAHILFLSGPFFETRHKALIASTMDSMLDVELATPQYKGLFYVMAAKQGYARAYFELGKYYKFEKDLPKAYEHLKKAQDGAKRLLEILKSDKEVLQNPGFFNKDRELFFQKNKEYIELELNAVQKLINQQALAMPQALTASTVSNQPPKAKDTKKRKKLKRKKAGKKSAANVNASGVASAVTSLVAPQDTTAAEPKNTTSKPTGLEKLPLVDAAEQPAKHQNSTVDITAVPAAPAAKKVALPTVESKGTVPTAKPKSGSVAVNNSALTTNQNINQRVKTSANVSLKPAINIASIPASATSSVPISNRAANYCSSNAKNNSRAAAAPTIVQKAATMAPPAKTSPTPRQAGKMSYADTLKKLTASTTNPTVGSSVDETKKNDISTANTDQSVQSVPIASVTAAAPSDNKSDKNFVAAPNFMSVNREESVTAPTPIQQQLSTVAPPQASLTYSTSVNLADDKRCEPIIQALSSASTVMRTPAASADPLTLAIHIAYEAGRRSDIDATNAFNAGRCYQYHLSAWGALSPIQFWLPPPLQMPTQPFMQYSDPAWFSHYPHFAVNIAPPIHRASVASLPLGHSNNPNTFLYHSPHPNPLPPGGNLTPAPDATQNGNTL